jgi:hypothetical protein
MAPAAAGATAVTAIVVATLAEPAIIERRVNPVGFAGASLCCLVTVTLLFAWLSWSGHRLA